MTDFLFSVLQKFAQHSAIYRLHRDLAGSEPGPRVCPPEEHPASHEGLQRVRGQEVVHHRQGHHPAIDVSLLFCQHPVIL